MLEVLITVGIVAGVVVGAFVGLVALMLFMAGVYAAAGVALNELTRPRNVWLPPKNQIQEAYKAHIQRSRDTVAYKAPIFRVIKGGERS